MSEARSQVEVKIPQTSLPCVWTSLQCVQTGRHTKCLLSDCLAGPCVRSIQPDGFTHVSTRIALILPDGFSQLKPLSLTFWILKRQLRFLSIYKLLEGLTQVNNLPWTQFRLASRLSKGEKEGRRRKRRRFEMRRSSKPKNLNSPPTMSGQTPSLRLDRQMKVSSKQFEFCLCF